MSTILDQLVDMGFSQVLAQAAIKQLNTQDLSVLIDWIDSHSGEEEKWTAWLTQPEG